MNPTQKPIGLLKIPERYFVPLRTRTLLNDEAFLEAVRIIRSKDNPHFHDSKSGRWGAYGFNQREWEWVSGRWSNLKTPEACTRFAYRWFVTCWHEVSLAHVEPSAYRIGVLWERGIETGLRFLLNGRQVTGFPCDVSNLYRKLNRDSQIRIP